MKSFIVLSLVLPFCVAIEVKFDSTYATGIKKVEIHSCHAEPCALVKGVPLNITITVETKYPKEKQFDTVSDLQTFVGIDGYRNRYIYSLADNDLYCSHKPDPRLRFSNCPLRFDSLYAIDRTLFLSKDDETSANTGFGSRNGKTRVMVNVVMMAHGMVGTVSGAGNIVLDIKANQ